MRKPPEFDTASALSRRSFLSGISTLALGAVLPRNALPEPSFLGIDLAAPGSERMALWVIEPVNLNDGRYRFPDREVVPILHVSRLSRPITLS